MNHSWIFFSLLIATQTFSQVPENILRYRNDAKGDYKNRFQAIMDGNNIRTRFNNNGQVGQWLFVPSLEWPKGTGHQYLDGYGILIAASIKAPGNGQVIHPLETSYREEMPMDPATGVIWGMEPVGGYANPIRTSPALSNDYTSYPAAWPKALGVGSDWDGSWYGYFGKGTHKGSLETFYVLDDSKDGKYKRAPYSFYPIATDSSRGGMGLRVEVRGMQFQDQRLQDVIIWDYKVINISDNNYDSTSFGVLIDPGVGGIGSGNDDGTAARDYDLTYFWDDKGKGDPTYGTWTPGYFGISMVHYPTSKNGKYQSTLSVNALTKDATGVLPKNNEVIWSKMTSGFVDTGITNANINAVVAGNLFSMPRWQSESFDIAMIVGNDLSDLVWKKYEAQRFCETHTIAVDSIVRYGPIRSTITSPAENSVLSGTATVKWDVQGAVGQSTSCVYVTNNTTDWKLVGVDNTGAHSLQWNTALVPDGMFYTFAIATYAENGMGFVENEKLFTVNNPGPAKPEIRLTGPDKSRALEGMTPIAWRGGDADGDSCSVNLAYRLSSDSKWTSIVTNVSASLGSYKWDTRSVPNSTANDYELRAEIISNIDTSTFTTGGYSIMNLLSTQHGIVDVISTKTTGTGTLTCNVIDPRVMTGHSYLLTFSQKSDQTLSGDITDLATGAKKIIGLAPLDRYHESTTFDGIRVSVANEPMAIDTSRCGWENNTSTFPMTVKIDPVNQPFTRLLNDYRITFSNVNVDTVGDLDPSQFPIMPIPFTVNNQSTTSQSMPLVSDLDGSMSLTRGDIIEIADMTHGALTAIVSVAFGSPDWAGPLPTLGDVYVIKSKRPFLVGDSIVFTPRAIPMAVTGDPVLPAEYSLSQNFPNPFNPTTTIEFSIPVEHLVSLKIYDILGKEVATLVHDKFKPGRYSVRLNGASLTSGVYFYRLQAGSYTETKHFTLVK
jgi:hypothetical protein